ncbi:MAG: hypothetical protein GY867_04700 [bacterium]|nr:hypothetical protein [bacterium]
MKALEKNGIKTNPIYLLLIFLITLKLRLGRNVKDFKLILRIIETCRPVSEADVRIALSAFARYWEEFELPSGLTNCQFSIFDELREHFCLAPGGPPFTVGHDDTFE